MGRKMKIVITMAGSGSRFKEAGVNKEKYKLRVKDRTMFEFAMSSLQAFFDEDFVFITQKNHNAREFVDSKCRSLGIEAYDIIELDRLTSGQATTALKADKYIKDGDAVAIYNIDTYIEGGLLTPEIMEGGGSIPVFESEGGSWSFVAVNDDGIVTEVEEKTPISTFASLGLYYFDRWESFVSAFNAAGSDVEGNYGERFIAPMYNWLIDEGLKVTAPQVPRSAVHILGTPEDVMEFDPEFASRYNIEKQ